MAVSVGSPGSIITRGLGSPLLVTRGYGRTAVVIIIEEIVVEPVRGRRPRSDKERRPEPLCYTISACLVEINGLAREHIEEHIKTVCFEPERSPGAKLLDVDVRQSGGRITISAQLESIVLGTKAAVSASLPIVTVDTGSLFVKADVERGNSGVKDVFIVVKRMRVRKDDDDE